MSDTWVQARDTRDSNYIGSLSSKAGYIPGWNEQQTTAQMTVKIEFTHSEGDVHWSHRSL